VKKGTGVLPFFLILLIVGCGKKGPPLPPLVRLPASPGDFTAERRGSTVVMNFVVPTANADGSTPADLSRVEIYALTGAPAVSPDDILKRGIRVGRVVVNPPPDPDAPEGEPPPAASAPRSGVDQGSAARVHETFTPDPSLDSSEVRSYVAVGFNKRGRRGATTRPMAVPLGAAPEAPDRPEVTWSETGITVTWPELSSDTDAPLAYRVYTPGEAGTRLTDPPLSEATFEDHRIEWGAERCYVVRSVETVEGLFLESEASPPTCVTLVDRFPPAAPVGLTGIAVEGAVNLIWDPNRENDLAGYLVLRAIAPESTLVPITPSPVVEPTFSDTVPSGARVTYAVQAVDKAGNFSPLSNRLEETAR
jgi:hypothetical protein